MRADGSSSVRAWTIVNRLGPIGACESALCARRTASLGRKGNDMGQRDFDMDLRNVKSVETEKLSGKTNFGFKFDPSLILLMFLIVCTAYVLTKLT